MIDTEPQATRRLPVLDRQRRELRDLRISVTDRCNFRCSYCMPREHYGPGFKFLPRAEILSYEEISRLARVFADLGVQKFRLTGGEPLLRADVTELVRMLSAIPGVEIALTTNGSLLAEKAGALAAAGLDRVTVSLDSLDDAVFRKLSDVEFPVTRVLEGIQAAAQAGLKPIKINAVIQRGVNDDSIVPLARHFKGSGHILRFIEFMDVGTTNGWQLERVVSGREIVEIIARELPIEPLPSSRPSDVARRFRYTDGSGEIGLITSVSAPFCGDCSRGRLSSDGKFYTCLFAARGTDLRGSLRQGASDGELRALVQNIWQGREDRYSELRTENSRPMPRVEMSYIGG